MASSEETVETALRQGPGPLARSDAPAHDGDVGVAREQGPYRAGQSVERRPALLLAEYESTAALVHAAEKIRDAGYEKWDTHTPFPVHGMDKAMGLRDTPLGWIVLIGGLTGCFSAFLMMYWMNGIDYPLVVGGKPPGAIPSMIPIMFEVTVLISAFSALLGMLHLARLPRHHHPVFYSSRFEGFSDDKFFVSIEAEDRQFDVVKTRRLLESTHPTHVELVEEEIVVPVQEPEEEDEL